MCRGEHCSPAWPYAAAKRYGSIWNAPLREPKRPPCVKGAGCAAAQTEGLRPYGYNPTRPYTLQSLRHGATSPYTVGSHPLHKGGFAVGCRGEHCSPAAISGNVRFHGSIWNAPLRRRGGFYIRPCNLGQRKISRASTARPYNALFRQSEAIGGSPQRLPLRGAPAQRVRGGRDATNFSPTSPPIKTTKCKTEECLRHSSAFCSYFALHTAIESVAIAQQICAN